MTPFRFCLQIFLGLAIIIATASAFVPQVFAQSLQGTLADERVAASMGLDVEWILQLPFDSTQWRLQHVVIGDGLVVAQSTDGGVHAIKTLTSSAPMTPRSSGKKPDQPSSIDIQPQPSPSRIADMPPGTVVVSSNWPSRRPCASGWNRLQRGYGFSGPRCLCGSNASQARHGGTIAFIAHPYTVPRLPDSGSMFHSPRIR